MLATLLKDIRQKALEHQRQLLEKEVILMINGQIPSDEQKIKRYHDLNRQLKGSVR
ncbi:MAG: hypothetical protein ACYC5N_05280 [Endomicrobiales bacterium]